MKICKESYNVDFSSLNVGDVFKIATSDDVLMKTDLNNNTIYTDDRDSGIAVSLTTGHSWSLYDSIKVVRYPNACVKLGEPFNG